MVPSIQATTLWGGLLILLVLALSTLVVRRRRRFQIAFGDGGHEPLRDAIRAFGNATEYVPIGICALILLAFLGVPPWLIHGVGGVMFTGRCIHGLGMIYQTDPSFGRVVGMLLTWLSLLMAAVVLVGWSVL
ncbi:MAPEG family protein [Brevundimonas vesicularis]|uniref:MAPEG family protein n=1 Tax=Brevundimonas vesicularis TaxID=41276 RepID=UPI0038D4218C